MKNFWFFSSLEQVFCEIECPDFFCIRPISQDAMLLFFFIYYIRLMSFAKNKIFFKTFSNILGPGNVSCRKWLLSAFITTKKKFHFPTCTESPSLRTHGSAIDRYLISSDGSACVFWGPGLTHHNLDSAWEVLLFRAHLISINPYRRILKLPCTWNSYYHYR